MPWFSITSKFDEIDDEKPHKSFAFQHKPELVTTYESSFHNAGCLGLVLCFLY